VRVLSVSPTSTMPYDTCRSRQIISCFSCYFERSEREPRDDELMFKEKDNRTIKLICPRSEYVLRLLFAICVRCRGGHDICGRSCHRRRGDLNDASDLKWNMFSERRAWSVSAWNFEAF